LKMATALVVSRFFPFDSQRVHAVYQRLGTQVEALGKVTDRVDCLFLVPASQDCSADELKLHEERLRRLWSPTVSLRLAPVVREDAPATRWQRLGRGIFDFHAQPIARPASSSAAVAAVASALDGKPQIVLAHRLSAMCVLMRLAHRLRGLPLYFDMDDIEHVSQVRRLLRHPSWPMERLMLLQAPRLLLAEIQAMRLATATFVCSDEDRRYLTHFVDCKRIQTVPNSVRFPPLSVEDPSDATVLFVGSMGYRPNAQAVEVLVQQIWPSIRERVPEARLVIVGSRAELTAVYPSRDPSVTFTGFVDDLDAWYRKARVICCPIYYGAGTRVKIIEAAAYAKAVVSTTLGAEGLDFENGREIILRDGAADLSEACVRLLRDTAAAARMGQAARDKARLTYDRGFLIDRLARLFSNDRIEGPRYSAHV
jgi:glycosyltransferase involved in cell wall biosynthesis